MIEVLWLYCWLALCVQNIISRILPISSFTAIMMNSIEVKHCSLCFHNGEPEEFYRWGNVYTTWWCNDAWSIDDASCSLIKIACFSVWVEYLEMRFMLLLCFSPSIFSAALTTWRPATAEWWPALCCASSSATSAAPPVMSPTPSGCFPRHWKCFVC